MGLLDLFIASFVPVLKVLLLTLVGSFLAMDNVDLLGGDARKHFNKVVFYVFNPALVASSLATSITYETMVTLWFMPINIMITYAIGSILGWIAIKVSRTPHNMRGLVLGCCASGNMGNLLLIIIPAVCKEKGSIFGDEDNCHTNGLAYTSISLAIGAICLWSYVYNIVRIYSEVSLSKSMLDKRSTERGPINFTKFPSLELLPLRGSSLNDDDLDAAELVSNSETTSQVSILIKIKEHLQTCARKMNFRTLFVPPPTIGAIIGFTVATVPQLRKLFISKGAPLRIFEDTALLIGEAAIPTVTLILGANLLKGLKQSGMQVLPIVGIIVVRYVALPVIGILVVKCATHFGLLHSDPLFRFVLLLHYALPPSMNIGTMTQLFGAGEGEFSLIMLWTYSLASVSLTLWATFFMWLLA